MTDQELRDRAIEEVAKTHDLEPKNAAKWIMTTAMAHEVYLCERAIRAEELLREFRHKLCITNEHSTNLAHWNEFREFSERVDAALNGGAR